ncbi:MAG: hypothetical protein ACRENY_05915 [Candidatus Dormibacteria bacterium]
MIWEVALYWVLVAAAGTTLVDLVPFDWKLAERLAAALLVGVVASSLLSLGLSLWWGLGPAAALAAPGALLLISGGLRAPSRWPRVRQGPGRWISWCSLQWARKDTRSGLLVTLVVGVVFYLIFTRAAQFQGQAVWANYPTVWSDWAAHASYAQSFLLGHNLPPQDVLESATGLRYPFLADFQSALLTSLGQNPWGAMDVSSWLIAWAAAVLVWQLAWRVTRRRSAASLALLLVLLGGGVGFIGLYADGCQQLAHTEANFSASSCTSLSPQTPGAVVAFLGHLPTELTHLPRSYDGQGGTPAVADLVWYEPLLAYWLPQRDFDYGMGLVALLAILLWEAYRGRRRGALVAAGILGAALPWFNPFGFLAIGLVGIWWLARAGWWRGLGLYLVPLLLLGLPRMLYVVSGPHGQLDSPAGTNLFPQLDLGWLAHSATSCTAAQFQGGAPCDALYLAGAAPGTVVSFLAQSLASPSVWLDSLGFWLANTGIFCLLALALVVLRFRPTRFQARIGQLQLLGFGAPFWVIFLICNVVVTQPWNWDNTKLLEYWYLGAAIPVAWLVSTVGGRGWWRLPATVAMVSLLLSGVLSMDLALVGQSSLAQAPPASTRLALAGPAEQLVAERVLRDTGPRAVFLTEGQPNEPVSILAGRTLVLGYDGWLWSYGQPLRARIRAVEAMYAGCPARGGCAVGHLLRAYHVSYVEFEPGDYNRLTVNERWYLAQHLPVLVRTQGYLILGVRRLWSA